MRKKPKSWLRRKIEWHYFVEFHFFEDGWELNKEFMLWKLKNYWRWITCMRHSGVSWYWSIPLFAVYLCMLPIALFIAMPIDVLKTPFVHKYGISQKYCMMNYKHENFGIKDPENIYYIPEYRKQFIPKCRRDK